MKEKKDIKDIKYKIINDDEIKFKINLYNKETKQLVKKMSDKLDRVIEEEKKSFNQVEKIIEDVPKLNLWTRILIIIFVFDKVVLLYVNYIQNYLKEYLNYVSYLFKNSSNDSKLNLVFIIPATALLTFLLTKLIPKFFKSSKNN